MSAALVMDQAPTPERQRVSELVLAALPNAVSCARLLLRAALAGRQFDQRCIQGAKQVMDELMAHAVATTGVSKVQPLYRPAFAHLKLLQVRLGQRPGSLVIEVWDSGCRAPHPRLRQALAGRQWGYDRPAPGRRVVWCVVPTTVPNSARGCNAGLPRRTPRSIPPPLPGAPVTAMRDPDLLQRVLTGLQRLSPRDEKEDPC